ncbi:MAG: hypothetical protein AB1705_05475 [Verrucomicrobiota bacterium]
MKTKALLLAGLVTGAGLASLEAQTVYSVNAVGFINVEAPPGFSMVANQLSGTANKLSDVLPAPPANTRVYKFNGTGFDIYQFLGAPFNAWAPDGNATFDLGGGAFVSNPTASPLTLTFVGEVPQGTLVNSLPAGFSIRSSMVPQAGGVSSALGFPAAANDRIYIFNGTTYDIYQLLGAPFNAWAPQEPTVNIGQSFFVFKSNAASWTRSFTVSPQ